MSNRTIAVALALLLGSASVVVAQGTNDPAKPFSATEMEKISAALSHQGYTAPSNIRRDGDGFLVTAVKNTVPQEVWVDPQSGVVKTMTK